jgi:hypothetical protein
VANLAELKGSIDAAMFEGVVDHPDINHRQEVYNRRIQVALEKSPFLSLAAHDAKEILRRRAAGLKEGE